ncbi:MAG: carbonic anhydrase [Waddliaceae bacterium]
MGQIRKQRYKQMPWLQIFSCLLLLFSTDIFAIDLFKKLVDGNLRFVNNTPAESNLSPEARKALAAGQTPFATIVACSDSRVAPEIIFDQGAGELFVVRLAGNTVDEFAFASIEYGVSYLKTPLLIVMGHAHCGAVEAAFNLNEGKFSPELTKLLKNIEPAVKQAIQQNPGKSKEALLNAAIRLNVHRVQKKIFNRIPAIEKLQKHGRLNVKSAVFEFDTGKVYWMD